MWWDLPVSPCEAILFAQPCIPCIQNRPVCSKFLRIRALLVGGGRGGTGYGRSYARNVWAPTDGGSRQFMLPESSPSVCTLSPTMPEYRKCWMHFKHIQHVFTEHADRNWTVLRLWANLTKKESVVGSTRALEALQADCRLTRGGGNKCCSQTSTRPETGGQSDLGGIDTMPGEHAHLPLWPPQLWNEECSEEVATKLLLVLSLKDFWSSPQTVVVDFGALLMQVCPPFRLFLGWLA